jgi:hypothetical protein
MKTTSVQLPKPLRAQLQKIAKAEGRSLASQIRIFLAESVTRTVTEKQELEDAR